MNFRTNYVEQGSVMELASSIMSIIDKETVIVCIGTDRNIGDCLAPIIGTFLKEKGFHLPIYGTVENPLHALNLKEEYKKIKEKHPDQKIIAIDATIGHVGTISLRDIPIYPGSALQKDLPPIGHYSIRGSTSESVDLLLGNKIRFNTVLGIANCIVNSIMLGYTLMCLQVEGEHNNDKILELLEESIIQYNLTEEQEEIVL